MRRAARLIVGGTLLCGAVDIADALVFSYAHGRTTPEILLQYIAKGLEGSAAFAQGWGGALLGLAVQYAISLGWVVLFVLIVMAVPRVLRWGVLFGAAYALAMYGVMNFVVLPAVHLRTHGQPHGAALANGVVALVVFGVLMAWLCGRDAGGRTGAH